MSCYWLLRKGTRTWLERRFCEKNAEKGWTLVGRRENTVSTLAVWPLKNATPLQANEGCRNAMRGPGQRDVGHCPLPTRARRAQSKQQQRQFFCSGAWPLKPPQDCVQPNCLELRYALEPEVIHAFLRSMSRARVRRQLPRITITGSARKILPSNDRDWFLGWPRFLGDAPWGLIPNRI